MKRLYLMFLLLGSSLCVNAEPASEQNTSSNQLTENLELNFCPSIEKIVYDPKTKLWSMGDWISSETSDDTQLVSFQGAQWVGANLGTIICVYKSNNPSSFPITIQNSTLAPAPTGSNWGKYQSGRKNCPPYTSDNPIDINDCPFYFPKKEAAPKDIYQQLDFFKGKKDSNSQ